MADDDLAMVIAVLLVFVALFAFSNSLLSTQSRPKSRSSLSFCEHCHIQSEIDVTSMGNHHEPQGCMFRASSGWKQTIASCKHCGIAASEEIDVASLGSHHERHCCRFRAYSERIRVDGGRSKSCKHCGVVTSEYIDVSSLGSHHELTCPKHRDSCKCCGIVGSFIDVISIGRQHEACCRKHKAATRIESILHANSSEELMKLMTELKPPESDMLAANDVVEDAKTVLSSVFRQSTFVKGGSLAKGTGLRDAMDIDLVVMVPGFTHGAIKRDYQPQARSALSNSGFQITSDFDGHVLKAYKADHQIDVVFTGLKVVDKIWWTWAASAAVMLAWFEDMCRRCPNFRIVCRALKCWRRALICRAKDHVHFPPAYAMEVVAADVYHQLSFTELEVNVNLSIYFCRGLEMLDKHLQEGVLRDPVNVPNNLLFNVSRASQQWLRAEIRNSLNTYQWA